MTKDATTLLIERIESELSKAGVSIPAASIGIVSQADNLLNNFADWAQLLSGPGGAAGQALADVVVGNVVNTGTTLTSAAGQTIGVLTAAETIGAASGSAIAAAIVIVVAVILAAISDSSDSGSSETEQIQQLSAEIGELEQTQLQSYWNSKLATIMTLWSPLGTDLDNIASEGIGSSTATVVHNPDVQNNVSHFHDDAFAFVNNFIPSMTPGAEEVFWQRPGIYVENFSAQDVYYPIGTLPKTETGGASSVVGWYGAWPQGRPAYPPGGFTNPPLPPAADPRTMLSFLLLGLKSYLTIQGLVHYINNSQLTFSDFLKDFQGDLQAYASFLYSQFTLAVAGIVTQDVLQGGIVKSDLPGSGDIMPFLCMIAVNQNSGPWPDIATWLGPDTAWVIPWPATAGMPWNGVYGAVDAHPNYGVHNPPPPVAVPSASASYIVDLINYDNLGAELNPLYQGVPNAPPGLTNAMAHGWKPPFPPAEDSQIERVGPLNFVPWLNWWTIPWVTMRVTLGTMARWKAIYLFNGYDKVWSSIQNLRVLAGQSLLPTPTLAQDETKANGNWSARELIARISSISPVVYETPEPRTTSLFFLVQTLDTIVNGNWAGPPVYPTSNGVPARPLGFRDRLAAAAV